jgi:hypothetical protein
MALTVTRMSLSLLLPFCLNPQSVQTPLAMLNRALWSRRQSTSLRYPPLFAQPSYDGSHTIEEL